MVLEHRLGFVMRCPLVMPLVTLWYVGSLTLFLNARALIKFEFHAPFQQSAPVVSKLVEPEPAVIELSEEQQEILDKARNGRSIFFTGSAGELLDDSTMSGSLLIE